MCKTKIYYINTALSTVSGTLFLSKCVYRSVGCGCQSSGNSSYVAVGAFLLFVLCTVLRFGYSFNKLRNFGFVIKVACILTLMFHLSVVSE